MHFFAYLAIWTLGVGVIYDVYGVFSEFRIFKTYLGLMRMYGFILFGGLMALLSVAKAEEEAVPKCSGDTMYDKKTAACVPGWSCTADGGAECLNPDGTPFKTAGNHSGIPQMDSEADVDAELKRQGLPSLEQLRAGQSPYYGPLDQIPPYQNDPDVAGETRTPTDTGRTSGQTQVTTLPDDFAGGAAANYGGFGGVRSDSGSPFGAVPTTAAATGVESLQQSQLSGGQAATQPWAAGTESLAFGDRFAGDGTGVAPVGNYQESLQRWGVENSTVNTVPQGMDLSGGEAGKRGAEALRDTQWEAKFDGPNTAVPYTSVNMGGQAANAQAALWGVNDPTQGTFTPQKSTATVATGADYAGYSLNSELNRWGVGTGALNNYTPQTGALGQVVDDSSKYTLVGDAAKYTNRTNNSSPVAQQVFGPGGNNNGPGGDPLNQLQRELQRAFTGNGVGGLGGLGVQQLMGAMQALQGMLGGGRGGAMYPGAGGAAGGCYAINGTYMCPRGTYGTTSYGCVYGYDMVTVMCPSSGGYGYNNGYNNGYNPYATNGYGGGTVGGTSTGSGTGPTVANTTNPGVANTCYTINNTFMCPRGTSGAAATGCVYGLDGVTAMCPMNLASGSGAASGSAEKYTNGYTDALSGKSVRSEFASDPNYLSGYIAGLDKLKATTTTGTGNGTGNTPPSADYTSGEDVFPYQQVNTLVLEQCGDTFGGIATGYNVSEALVPLAFLDVSEMDEGELALLDNPDNQQAVFRIRQSFMAGMKTQALGSADGTAQNPAYQAGVTCSKRVVNNQ